jgi:O-antigen/teichoic acid export membrane protein
MDNIIKVTFPTYSRLQDQSELLTKAVNASIQLLALASLPIAIGMMFTIRPLIEIIPRYVKWEPALFSFYLFTISVIFSSLSSPLVNVLNALGRVKYTFYLMIIWTTLTWVFVPVSVRLFGFNGVAIAALIIGTTSFIPILFIPKQIQVNYFSALKQPFMATFVMSLCLFLFTRLVQGPTFTLIGSILIGSTSYLVVTYLLLGHKLKSYFQLFSSR